MHTRHIRLATRQLSIDTLSLWVFRVLPSSGPWVELQAYPARGRRYGSEQRKMTHVRDGPQQQLVKGYLKSMSCSHWSSASHCPSCCPCQMSAPEWHTIQFRPSRSTSASCRSRSRCVGRQTLWHDCLTQHMTVKCCNALV